MKKIILFILTSIFFILFLSCSNTETYYGQDAAFRFFSAKVESQAMIEDGDKITFICINRWTKTKYEYSTITVNGENDIDKSVLKVTKNCDVDKELAECMRLELLREKNKRR